MKLNKFLTEIEKLMPSAEELSKANLPLSEQDRWEIDVLNDEFQAYDGPIIQIVYCLDEIQLFFGFRQLSDIDEDAPYPYLIWGENTSYGFHYAFNSESDEIVLLDDLKSPEPNMYCAASGAKFLDCLVVAAEFERLRVLDPDMVDIQRDTFIERAIQAAGGKKYEQHCKVLLG